MFIQNARAPHTRWLSLLVLVLLVSSMGCGKRLYLDPCDMSGTPGICGGVGVSFDQGLSSVNAWSIYETREVDPNVYAHDSGYTPNGTIRVTLANGGVVSYHGSLYLDTSTSVAPTTSGHQVLVYRPSDPSSLQNFINQYKDAAASVDIDTMVRLRDISGGSVGSSIVDAKGNYNSNPSYIGSVNSTPPTYEPGILQKDF